MKDGRSVMPNEVGETGTSSIQAMNMDARLPHSSSVSDSTESAHVVVFHHVRVVFDQVRSGNPSRKSIFDMMSEFSNRIGHRVVAGVIVLRNVRNQVRVQPRRKLRPLGSEADRRVCARHR